MTKRSDLYRRAKPPHERAKRKPLTTTKIWQVVGGLFVIWTGIAGFFFLIGADFDSEYRSGAWFTFSDVAGVGGRRKLSVCGMARTLLPGSIEDAISCVLWNLGAFYIMPVIALVYAVKASVTRR